MQYQSKSVCWTWDKETTIQNEIQRHVFEMRWELFSYLDGNVPYRKDYKWAIFFEMQLVNLSTPQHFFPRDSSFMYTCQNPGEALNLFYIVFGYWYGYSLWVCENEGGGSIWVWVCVGCVCVSQVKWIDIFEHFRACDLKELKFL